MPPSYTAGSKRESRKRQFRIGRRDISENLSHRTWCRACQPRHFLQAARGALERILVSPQCLYRIEAVPATVPASGNYRISQLELASRLSFFLWSSIPDDQLLNLATAGPLERAARSGAAGEAHAGRFSRQLANAELCRSVVAVARHRKRQSRSDHVSVSGQNVTAVAA